MYKLATWIVAACSALLLGTAAAPVPASASEHNFTIGSVLDPNINIPLLVADQKGFFERHAVPVEVKLFPSGAEIVQAIAGESIDFGATGGVPATILAGRGVDVKVIARDSDISYELAIATTQDSGISKPEDIKGKTVGMTAGTVSQYLVLAMAKHWDLPLDSFEMVNLGPADQLNALAQGSIQVISVWEPFTSRHVESGGVILQTALVSHWPGMEGEITLVGDPGIIFARNEYLVAHPEVVKEFLLAVKEATDWVHQNPDEAAQIAAEALNASETSMRAVIDKGYIYFNFDQHLVDELTAEADFLKEYDLVPADFEVKSWLAPEYMQEVLPDLVTYQP